MDETPELVETAFEILGRGVKPSARPTVFPPGGGAPSHGGGAGAAADEGAPGQAEPEDGADPAEDAGTGAVDGQREDDRRARGAAHPEGGGARDGGGAGGAPGTPAGDASLEEGDAGGVEEGGDDAADGTEPPAAGPQPAAGADSGDEAEAEADGAGAELDDEELLARVAALLFASPEPLSQARLAQLLERPPAARVRAAIEELGRRLEGARLPIRVRALAGGWTLLTAPELGEVVAQLQKSRKVERVSPAALETLAVIAYRQPVTKAEIEAIRGVQAGPVLRSLVDRGLVRVTGRADQPGHPLQYGTTREFLDRFGLQSLGDLPRDAELAKD